MSEEPISAVAVVVKKRRRGVVKSKTGCLTCRIRHIKCDESRSACKRCTDTGRRCDFLDPYPEVRSPQPAKQSDKSKDIEKVIKIKYHLLPKPTRSPSSPLSVHEIDHLEYFHLISTTSFSSHCGNSLWTKTIFQISHSEPAIRNAVIALATLLRHPARTMAKQESTCNYMNAVRALNHRLDGSDLSWKLALISSLLFTAFEAIGGTDKAALQHLLAGFAMLKEYSLKLPNHSDTLSELSSAFSSFDIQASTFASFYSPICSNVAHIPPFFTSIGEAREALGTIIASIHTIWKANANKNRTLPYMALPPTIAEQVNEITALLSQWSSTFTAFLVLSAPSISSIAVQILQIQHLAAHIQISTYFYRDQLAYDAFNAKFMQIVALASAVVEKMLVDSGGIVPRFSFEVGIIPSLYFAARRCRDPILRRRAIGLLEKSGNEGLWDGEAMAAAARWILKLEEEADNRDGGFVPETRRLREIGVTIDRLAKRMRLVSSIKAVDGTLSYVAGDVGWGENAAEVVDDEVGLALCIEEWRRYMEGSSPSHIFLRVR